LYKYAVDGSCTIFDGTFEDGSCVSGTAYYYDSNGNLTKTENL
jgi:hypothetical protein